MRQFGPDSSTGRGAGFFSSASRLRLPPGERVSEGGYHLDLRAKAPAEPGRSPGELPRGHGFVALAQTGLGHVERFVAGEGEAHLARAVEIGRHLIACQHRRPGPCFGGLRHEFAYTHGRPLAEPWLSAMAQGELASLLARLARFTGDAAFTEAADDALAPLEIPVAGAGVAGAFADGGFFPEEYPTEPQSHVLNGGIFALWGLEDAAACAGLERWRELFAAGVDALARNIESFDLGYWSRYDLFPFRPLRNVSSSFYHVLQIDQLDVLGRLAGEPRLLLAARTFERQYDRRAARALAFAHKASFRVFIPRHAVVPPRTSS